ncbi:transcription termination/antitermination NusG family protein [Antarcticirhabdus aurantiaca]|uniref:Uncharacterized protein n=1 Tax=Antarcticirhabdus aurantiaca TaxID=2606717 RepID=A0ACD4NLB7_9HYPH|nr:hypothetical protein OXU80_22350 [Jeongeuplla avenae]
MTWIAIRTAPGAQMPRRQYVTERTRSRKGYRIVPSLDQNRSAVERALDDAGFAFYMPAEKRLIRDRLRPYLWKHRRFALMVGYVFVHAHDGLEGIEEQLRQVPGVAGIVSDAGRRPLPIPLADIMMVRAAEAKAEAEFDKQSREARQQLRKAAKEDPSLRKIVEKLDIAGTITVADVAMAA